MSEFNKSHHPAITVGTSSWEPTAESEVKLDEIVKLLRKHGVTILDTARMYGMGASETVLGNKGLSKEFQVITKPATGIIPGTSKQLYEMAKQSLKALQTESVGHFEPVLNTCVDANLIIQIDTYIFHGPDEVTPFEFQVDIIQKLYQEGRIKRFGFSNFTKDQVLEFYNLAKAKGYVLPSVYQASYSPAVRRNESLLFPTLRKLGFSIQAYSPMAGGFLAKTPEYIEQEKGLWDPSTPFGRMLRNMYYKPSYLKMLREFGQLSETSRVSRVGLAYRWVRYHSILRGDLGDEIIIGGNSTEQVEEALIELEKGPLDTWIVDKIDSLWEGIRDDSPIDNLESCRMAYCPTP